MSSSTKISGPSSLLWSATAYVMVWLTQIASADPVTTRHSDWIANSVGVNTHFDYLAYHSQDENFFQQILKPRLIESGIRHVRDSTGASTDYTAIQRYARRLAELSAAGIDFILQTHPSATLPDLSTENPDPNAPLGLRQKLRAYMRGDITFGNKLIPKIPGLVGVMQPNEMDHIPSFDANCLVQGDWYTRLTACNPAWYDNLNDYMQSLHSIMQDPELQGLTLYGPSLVHIESYQSIQVGPNETLWDRMQALHQYFDIGAVNFYAWPGPHTTKFAYYLNPRAQFYGNKRFIITEMGNYNKSFGQVEVYGVSKQVQAIYLLRGLVEHLRRDPYSLQFVYELYDQGDAPYPYGAPTVKEGSFGLLENDGSPKLAFEGLKNLIALTADQGDQYTPQPLDLRLISTSSNVHTLVTQKRNGRYIVLIWDENPNISDGNYRSVPTKLTFDQEWDVSLYDPLLSADIAQANWSAATAIDLDVPDSVVVLELREPQTIESPTVPTPTPQPSPSPIATTTPETPGVIPPSPTVPPEDVPSEMCSITMRSQGRAVTVRLLNTELAPKQRLLVSASIGARSLWKRSIRISTKRVYKIKARTLKPSERTQVTIVAVRSDAPDVMLCAMQKR